MSHGSAFGNRPTRSNGGRTGIATAVGATSILALMLAACSNTVPVAAPRAFIYGSAAVPVSTTTTSEDRGWTPVSYDGAAIAVDTRSFLMADGHRVTVARFRTRHVRFDLHIGTRDPHAGPGGVPPQAGASISASELPVLLGAFNGGFYTSTGSGGVEVDGQILNPLKDGMASFVIDKSGEGHVGIWGRDLPAPGEQVSSVRQNLPPLVVASQPAAAINDVFAWGATVAKATVVSRSGLGEDHAGDILYAGSGTGTLPLDIAQALVDSGATTAMELDINPEWVQLDLSQVPGGPLAAEVPGQRRPASQYLTGWTRDFVTVLAPPWEGKPTPRASLRA